MEQLEYQPGLDERRQFDELEKLALSFNERINLYSADSTRNFYDRHIRHSLALASRAFPDGSVVADWGTGGGMPGLALAIVFPRTTFHLVDSVGKKVRAVRAMARRLELENVEAHHVRAEDFEESVTHSVSRATAPLSTLWHWHERVARRERTLNIEANEWPQGLICLKGGDLKDEIATLEAQRSNLRIHRQSLLPSFEAVGLEEKSLVWVAEPD